MIAVDQVEKGKLAKINGRPHIFFCSILDYFYIIISNCLFD